MHQFMSHHSTIVRDIREFHGKNSKIPENTEGYTLVASIDKKNPSYLQESNTLRKTYEAKYKLQSTGSILSYWNIHQFIELKSEV